MSKSHHPGLIALGVGALFVLLPSSGSAQEPINAPAGGTDANVVTAVDILRTPEQGAVTTKGLLSDRDKERLNRIKHWLQPISSSGVRADVLARALTATTDNSRGRQIAVPWSQAMPGGYPSGENRPAVRVHQNQIYGSLQIIYHEWEEKPDYRVGYRYRTEIPLTLPSGNLDRLKWARSGTPLLIICEYAYARSEIDFSGAGNFHLHHSIHFKSGSSLTLRQGEHIPFNQVILQRTHGGGLAGHVQLMLLRGEQRNQFRVCINTDYWLFYGTYLTCNVWQVPHDYWRRPQPLEHIGPYMVKSYSSGSNSYWRYRP